jgi:DNA-binding NtrC family response regulator
MKENLSILVADADRDSRSQLVELIASLHPGTQIRVAETGPELFEALQENKFDLLFLDMVLPYTDVVRLRRIIKYMHSSAGTKLVLITEKLRADWTSIALCLDAYEVLVKPYKSTAVMKMMGTHADMRKMRDALIVDASAKVRSLLRSVFDDSQFRMTTVDSETGRRAVRHGRTRKFDIAFIGSSLTDMPALEVGCQLLNLSEDKTAIVLMEREITHAASSLAMLGVKDVIQLPFDVVEINRSLYGALGLWRPYLMNALIAQRALGVRDSSERSKVA